VKEGTATLGMLADQAIRRLLKHGKPSQANLFSEVELQRLADQIAATRATGQLLGRSRIRLRLGQARKHHETLLGSQGILGQGQHGAGRAFAEADRGSTATSFSDQPTDFSEAFAESVHPMSPAAALAHFQALVPSLSLDEQEFVKEIGEEAFALAEATDAALLARVHQIIQSALETGAASKAVPQIQEVLDRAGVTPANPQRSEMIFRTNAMSAYNAGAMKEMQDPDVADSFPVWQYLGIDDGRQGEDHAIHFDQYFDNATDFDDVRGERVQNCRCTPSPVYVDDWDQLQADGAEVSDFHESFGGAGSGRKGHKTEEPAKAGPEKTEQEIGQKDASLIPEGVGTQSTPAEHAAAVALASRKLANVTPPSEEDVAKAKAGMAELGANKYRKKLVGNVTNRANRRKKLLKEFGNGTVCPCLYCGIKISHGTLEQDKILTTAQGGKYRMDNIVPSCSDCNKRRSDMPFTEALQKVVKYAAATGR